MSDDAKHAVRAQFGRQAPRYAVSAFHSHSEGLGELLRLAAPTSEARALDVATGTGFTALALAPRVDRVVGLDLTLGMVREARRLAADRGVFNLTLCLGDAEALPFRSRAFDIVTCRVAAHHFPDLPGALAEMARVVKTGGRVVLDDTCAPEIAELARLMNEWELRRDRSHVANHPPSRLRAMLEQSGLGVRAATMIHVPQEFGDWVERSGIPMGEAAELRERMRGAPPEARAAFRIRVDGDQLHFAWDEIVILAIKQ
ncbi:MAG TPA: methyltransferase domain-containing protein [bacterium]|nr:methyltransferase domain-containing protein [bacterium]